MMVDCVRALDWQSQGAQSAPSAPSKLSQLLSLSQAGPCAFTASRTQSTPKSTRTTNTACFLEIKTTLLLRTGLDGWPSASERHTMTNKSRGRRRVTSSTHSFV